MTHRIETLIDGEPFAWSVDGDFGWGSGEPLSTLHGDPVPAAIGAEGYRIVDLPAGMAEKIRDHAAAFLGISDPAALDRYHEGVDDAAHADIINRSRELRLKDFDLDGATVCGFFGGLLGMRLSPILPVLGTDHVQLRINRPGSTDYNPPHRDGSLEVFRSTVNIWMPVAAVDQRTSLPLVAGSHAIAERDCWQTLPGGATIDGKPYRVPAIGQLRGGPLNMIRPKVLFGQALMFTPYLVHGLAFNRSGDRTRMALELRFHIEA